MDTRIGPLYLDSLGGDGQTMAPAMALALQANFGSVERWREEFVAMGKAPGGGSGWVLLCFQPREGTLVNQWAADPTHAIAGAVPILAMDLHEHADHRDHGAALGPPVDAFMASVDWAKVYGRYQLAVDAASEALAASAEDLSAARVLDVRRAGVYQQADAVIPGSAWRDPGTVGEWAAEMQGAEPVIVYCVYGHEVGRATALRLHAAGVPARFLRGGIDGWVRAGRPVQAKGSTA